MVTTTWVPLAQYFKIVDISNKSDFTDANANGFDLDAVKCNGEGGAIFFELNDDEIHAEDITVGPNPATDHIDANLSKLFVGSKG